MRLIERDNWVYYSPEQHKSNQDQSLIPIIKKQPNFLSKYDRDFY